MAAPAKPGGFKLSLAGAKNKAALRNPPTNLAKRPRLALGDDEPEDEVKQQAISGFDLAQGGAVEINGKPKEEKKLLVIPALPNKNLRDEARRRHAARTGHGQKVDESALAKEEQKIQYGLTIVKKDQEENGDTEGDVQMAEPAVPLDDGLTDEQRLEKRAVQALLNDKAPTDATTIPLLSEEEIFAADLAAAPDAPSLDAYEATPIEGFGAAMLRGMGWKDGEELGRNKAQQAKPRDVKPRPALLGIGAKDEAAAGIETQWEKGKPKRKAAQTYNPVALRNKITGELVTEEELKERLERQKLDQERERKEIKYSTMEFEEDEETASREKKSRDRDRQRKDDRRRERRDRSRDRDRDRVKDKDRDRDRDRRRDRSRSKDHARSDRGWDRDRDDRKRRREYEDEREDRKRRHRERSRDDRYRK